MKPEIVITEDRMENMTGLELIQHCRAEKNTASFIVLSKEASVERMQIALENEVSGYLILPIEKEKLSAAMHRAVCRQNELKEYHRMVLEKQQLRILNLVMKCRQDLISEQEYDQLLSGLGVNREYRFLGAAVHVSTYRHDRYGSVEEVYDSIRQNLSMRMSLPYRILSYGKAKSRFFLFMDCELEEKESQMQNMWVDLVLKMKNNGAILSVGLSKPEKRIDSGLLLSAEKALNQRFESGIGEVYSSHAVKDSEGISQILDIPSFEQRVRNKEGAEAAAEFEKLAEQLQPHIYNLEFLFQYLYDLLIEMGYSPDKKFWRDYIENKGWSVCKNMEEIKDSIREELIKSCDRINTGGLPLHERAKIYIDKYFREDLSLGEMARQFHLNSRYFAAVFKKEEGISPTDYLTKVRIEEACRMLAVTEAPASEIAASVGYEDPRYFYKVFKKMTGLTPKEYRQEQRDEMPETMDNFHT